MKTLITALAALALVACTSEPNTPTDVDTSVETPAAKARIVSLNVAGMT